MYNLIWKNKITRYPDYNQNTFYKLDELIAQEIIEEAYEDGFINWNVYKKARDKVRTKLNGSWMFEQKEE